jgi:hypothetical protein
LILRSQQENAAERAIVACRFYQSGIYKEVLIKLDCYTVKAEELLSIDDTPSKN